MNQLQIDKIFESSLDSLINYCKDELDNCESDLEFASQKILESELQEGVDSLFKCKGRVKKIFKKNRNCNEYSFSYFRFSKINNF